MSDRAHSTLNDSTSDALDDATWTESDGPWLTILHHPDGRRVGESARLNVLREGLPVAVGEPAINPVPRKMIGDAIADTAAAHGGSGDVVVTVSVDGGAALAEKTWNPRLGIVGGISILGTTGVVVPYSCAAWIESIHRGIDVSRAAGETVIAGCTGKTSEEKTQALLGLPDHFRIVRLLA